MFHDIKEIGRSRTTLTSPHYLHVHSRTIVCVTHVIGQVKMQDSDMLKRYHSGIGIVFGPPFAWR